VEDLIRRIFVKIFEYRLKGRPVTVNIRYDGDPHMQLSTGPQGLVPPALGRLKYLERNIEVRCK